jgi:hypothetical protein
MEYISPIYECYQLPILWVQRQISLGLKRPGHEADHSPLCSTEVKNDGAVTTLPYTKTTLPLPTNIKY